MNLNDVIDRLIELRKINDSGKLPVYVGGERDWFACDSEYEVTDVTGQSAEYETECCNILVTETIKGEAICPCCDKPSRVTNVYPERIRIEL